MNAALAVPLFLLLAATPSTAGIPGEVADLQWCPTTLDCLQWTPVAGAQAYRVYRGNVTRLAALQDATPDSCHLGTFDEPSTGSQAAPPPGPGHGWWYLVTALDAVGTEGDPGSGAAGPRALDAYGACTDTAALRLNELDYDQIGEDRREFVEVLNGGATSRDLQDVVLILVNGLTGNEYRRVALATAGPELDPGQYLVIGSGDVLAGLAPDIATVTLPAAANNIQNGAPDGVALFDLARGELLDALAYEGPIHGASFEGVAGTFDLVSGMPAGAADSNVQAGSLARRPDGTDSGNDDADWVFGPASPGGPNPAR